MAAVLPSEIGIMGEMILLNHLMILTVGTILRSPK